MRRAFIAVLLLSSLSPLACGGGDDAPSERPARACSVVVWHKPASPEARVEIVGDFGGWKRPGATPAARDDGWRVATFDVAPGEHTYAIIEDGVWLADRNVPTTATRDGHEVTWVDVPDCDRPGLRVAKVEARPGAPIRLEATFVSARDRAALDPATLTATPVRAGAPARVVEVDAARGKVVFEAPAQGGGQDRGKYTYLVRGKDERGRDADEAVATAWVEATPYDPRDLSVYQIIVDRFADASGPVAAPADPAGRAGGTIAGVRRFLASGALERMGANALWLSPLYENPAGTYPGNDGRMYSSYHGYWPTSPRAIDPRVASEADLDALVAEAHARGVRVLFDVVPNHVHERHPYATKSDFTDGARTCVCGQGSCDWASHIQDCWFAPYLPDMAWSNPDVARQVSSDVRWWIDRFDGDGVRIDAVPMMPRSATRRIAAAIRARYDHPGHKSFVLGENFTGPGGYDLLRYHLGPYGLDSQFHFPLMWALRRAIAEESAPMSDVDGAVRTGEEEWAGSGAVMGLIVGNHDVSRFVSVAAGNAGGDGWQPAAQPIEPRPYEKQRLALGAVCTLPGAPVLYYGDEVALAGRQDPDSRRVMPRDEALTAQQRDTRAFVERVGALRRCASVLRRGTYRALSAGLEHVAFAREAPGEATALVVLARSPSTSIGIPLAGIAPGTYVDALGGGTATLSGDGAKLEARPFSVQVLLPEGHRCLTR